jgi:histidyl-tRNA synthetase
VLERLGFAEFELRLNHRQVLAALLTNSGIPSDKQGEALVALDKLDKLGRDGVAKEMQQRGIDAAAHQRLLMWMDAASRPDWLDWQQRELTTLEEREGFENLREIVRLSAQTSAGPHIRLQPSLARGLSYYTGAIMEIVVPDLAGSLGGGGRYDGLIGMFCGESIPACGFSLGLERILVVMAERQMFPPGVQSASADVVVTMFDSDGIEDTLRLARDLRSAGLRVEVYPEPDKIGKQFKYASARGVRYVTITGGDERASGSVTVKNMETGEQAAIPRTSIAGWLAARTQSVVNS